MSSTNENATIEHDWKPSAEFRYFIYDPDGEGFIYYKSAADRDADSQSIIAAYCDEGWSDEVERIIAGEITHTCEKTNVRPRPPEDEIDGEGCDGEGDYWAEEWSYKCNYELIAVEQEAATQGEGEQPDAFEVARHSKRLVENLRSELSAVTAERDQLRAEVDRYVPLHEAVQRAAGELPEGWAIQLYIERDGGGVELIGPDGTEDFATNNERLDYTVIDALEAAMAAKEVKQ